MNDTLIEHLLSRLFWKFEGRSWKIFNATTGNQCSLVRAGVRDRFFLYRKLPVRALTLRTRCSFPRFLADVSWEINGVYSSLDGNRPSNLPPCKPSLRRYIHVYDVRLRRAWNEPPYIHCPRDCWMIACRLEICQSFALLIASNILLYIQ